MTDLSSSQKTFLREVQALEKMPRTRGEAACTGDDRFDVTTQKEDIAKATLDSLAEVCAKCPLWDCGWRLVKTD